jgi:hypothetical protein
MKFLVLHKEYAKKKDVVSIAILMTLDYHRKINDTLLWANYMLQAHFEISEFQYS